MRSDEPAEELLHIGVARDPSDLRVRQRGLEEIARLLLGVIRVARKLADCPVGPFERAAIHERANPQLLLKFTSEFDVGETVLEET